MMNYPGSLSRAERIEKVTKMCKEHNCSPNIAKIHFEQFVEGDWHPHPPQSFIDWWDGHKDGPNGQGVKPKIAWNCQCYRDEYMEAKRYGIVSPS